MESDAFLSNVVVVSVNVAFCSLVERWNREELKDEIEYGKSDPWTTLQWLLSTQLFSYH